MKPVSQAERSFFIDGCNMGIRYDGRDADSFRTISIENSILPQVNGSSRLKIDNSTDVVCSVKLEISETRATQPDTGILQVNVDISPSCNIYAEERNMQAYETLIEQRIESMLLSSNALNMKKFCILSGKYCWKVHLDFLILELDGEPTDACCMAAYTAFDSTVVPATRPIPGESGLLEDFDVEGDLSEGSQVSLENFPMMITLSKVGNIFIVDGSSEEQQCASSVVSIAVDRNGNVCGLTYLQSSLLSIQDIKICKKKAYSVASAIFADLDKYIQKNKEKMMNVGEKEGVLHPDVPLSRLGLLM